MTRPAPPADTADQATGDMAWVPGGQFRMGSDRHYPEERPTHVAEADGFWMDRAPVTNAAFAAFVQATGYRTSSELPPDPAQYPDAAPARLRAGSTVFKPPSDPGGMRAWGDWWAFVPGAHWRLPDGARPHAGDDHPVVHVAHGDAAAYAAWAGKALPTETEWEMAAWGGQGGTEFAWGDALAPAGVWMANTWQGCFPFEDLAEDGHAGTSPVGSYPPNARGLADMIGNVWEWTSSPWTIRHDIARACCTPCRRTGPGAIARNVIKGGSHLCAPSYCRRYRPSARQGQAIDSGTTHIGFRCVRRTHVPS